MRGFWNGVPYLDEAQSGAPALNLDIGIATLLKNTGVTPGEWRGSIYRVAALQEALTLEQVAEKSALWLEAA
ncbi:hypothetical protein [Wenxinia saemankumensis]|uniref:hypothetical protein n=1 Tax=Wenxinia saemankumensis TaxID=1447782 RepID=UPI001115403E|nr:hypothetical protein [Wenxinia saemankumensis]